MHFPRLIVKTFGKKEGAPNETRYVRETCHHSLRSRYPMEISSVVQAFQILMDWRTPADPARGLALKACRAALSGEIVNRLGMLTPYRRPIFTPL